MLYELISVVRPGSNREVKEIAKTAGAIVLRSGGVIRGLTNWGVFHLPKGRAGQKGGSKHYAGHHFIMRFDSSVAAQQDMRRTLALEPRLLRFSVVKLGSRLSEISRIGGAPEEWADLEDCVPQSAAADNLDEEQASSSSLNEASTLAAATARLRDA